VLVIVVFAIAANAAMLRLSRSVGGSGGAAPSR